MPKGQAERLAPMVAEALAAAGVAPAGLDGVAVCTGPGNFTGVRIGVTFARGLALSLGRPAVGVTRFEALAAAEARRAGPGRVAVALSARRGEIAAQVLDATDPDAPEALADPVQGTPEAVAAALASLAPARAIGPLPDRAAAPADDLADAAEIARLAARRLASGEPLPRPAPVYLRPPDAASPSEAPPALLTP